MYPKLSIDIYYQDDVGKNKIFFGIRDVSKNIFELLSPSLQWSSNKKIEDLAYIVENELSNVIKAQYGIYGGLNSIFFPQDIKKEVINYINNNFGNLNNFYVLTKNYLREYSKINNMYKYYVNNFNHLNDIKNNNKKIYNEKNYKQPMLYMDLFSDRKNNSGYIETNYIKDSLYSYVLKNEESLIDKIGIFDDEEKKNDWNKKISNLLLNKYISFAFTTNPVVWPGIELDDIKSWEKDIISYKKEEPNVPIKDIVDEIVYHNSYDYIENSLWEFHEDAIESVDLDEADRLFNLIKKDLEKKQKVSKKTLKEVIKFNDKKYVISYIRNLNEIVLFGNTNIDNELNKLNNKINEIKNDINKLDNNVFEIINIINKDNKLLLSKDNNSIKDILEELKLDTKINEVNYGKY